MRRGRRPPCRSSFPSPCRRRRASTPGQKWFQSFKQIHLEISPCRAGLGEDRRPYPSHCLCAPPGTMFAVTQTASRRLSQRCPIEGLEDAHRPRRRRRGRSPLRGRVRQKAMLTGIPPPRPPLAQWIGGQAATVFAGKYIDPNHPHCPREIDMQRRHRILDPVPFAKGRGMPRLQEEERGCGCRGWEDLPLVHQGVVSKDDATILIDFDQKDGSGESFTGKWNGVGIEFPDGNVWGEDRRVGQAHLRRRPLRDSDALVAC